MPTNVTVFWRDNSHEPLRTTVEMWDVSNGVLVMELTHDLLPPSVESKALVFPMRIIHAIEVVDTPESAREGYREDNSFRETPENSKWFRGMGQSKK